MKLVLVIAACACGVALILAIPTGKIDPLAVAGAGIICAAIAQVVN